MRRPIRKDILITSVPPKPPNKIRRVRKKNPNERCRQLVELYASYVERCEGKYAHQDLADAVGVRENTARRWLYGFPPGAYNIWPIARYFAPLLGLRDRVVFDDITKALEEWRKR